MKHYYKLINILSTLFVAVALIGCANEFSRSSASTFGPGTQGGNGGGANGGGGGGGGGGDDTTTQLSADRNGTIGMRNFRQLAGSLSAVTGVPSNTAQVITQLTNTQSSLSIDGDATKVNSATLLKAMELAAVYCLNAANNATIRTRVYGNFDFAATPANIADATLATLAESILTAFIPDSSMDAGVSEKIQVLVDMMKAIRASAAAGAAAATTRTNMVVGGCAAVASSQGFLFLN